jgi:hypothetical protein
MAQSMSNVYRKSSNKTVRRGRERQGRRLRLEALERRDCPAVMFDFDGGVLNVTGDEGPNVIEIIWTPEGVQAAGDGEQRMFEGVGEVVVATGDGDDVIQADGLPNVQVRDIQLDQTLNTMTINAGAGDDLVTIGDGDGGTVAGRITGVVIDPMDASIDLGTGADKLVFQVERHGTVNVDVNSADSFDSVQVGVKRPLAKPIRLLDTRVGKVNINLAGGGHLIDVQTVGLDDLELNLAVSADLAPSDPARNTIYVSTSGGGVWRSAAQENREAAARVKLELGGGDNAVDVLFENIEDVDLSIVSISPTQRVTGGGKTKVEWVYGVELPRSPGGFDGVVILHSSLPGGSAVPRTIGDSPTSFSFTATAGRAGAPSSANIAGQLGAADDTVSIQTRNIDGLKMEFDTGEGNDTLVVDAQTSHPYPGYSRGVRVAVGDVNLGEGNDVADIKFRGYADVSLDLSAGAGNDRVKFKPLFAFPVEELDSRAKLTFSALLGTGDDRLGLDTSGYAQAATFIDAGAGNDAVNVRHRMFAVVDRSNLSVVVLLGAGSDTLALESSGYRQIETEINTGPAGDGRDRISTSHHSLRKAGRVQNSSFNLDGRSDVSRHRSVGYTSQVDVVGVVAVEYLIIQV